MSEVIYKIELAPPAECETGAGCFYVIRGYCFHPHKRTAGLTLLVGGQASPIDEFEDFRPDIAVEFADRDEIGSSIVSGFFAAFVAPPQLAGSQQTLALDIAFADGSRQRVEIGRIAFLPPALPRAEVPVAKLAICLATWNPEHKALARQIDSLFAQ